MATNYEDSEEATLERDEQCYAWLACPPVLDWEKFLKSKNDVATEEESSDEESN